MDTINTALLSGLRRVNVNLLIIAVTMVMLTFGSSPMDNYPDEVSDGSIDLSEIKVIPSNVKCILVAPGGSENSPIRRKRSNYDDKFNSFSILGLGNVDLMTTILDKSRFHNSETRPDSDRTLMQLMARYGRK